MPNRNRYRYFALVDGETFIEGEVSTTRILKPWMLIEQAIESHTRDGDTISATVIKLDGRGRGEFDRVYNNVKGSAVRARSYQRN